MYRKYAFAGLSCVVAYLAWTSSETWHDAPFSIDKASLGKVVECPRGISGAAGGIVLLVPGTLASGGDEWPGTPYYEYLPYEGPGYDVCWFNNPSKGLGDAQVSSEYLAYNIPILAKKSATGKIALIGHSQGAGLTPQWAFNFWPSTRKYVSAFVAISGPFHGLHARALCKAWGMSEYFPSFCQMDIGSAYMLANNQQGGHALVPTTSIWSRVDATVPPASSRLDGAANFEIQQPDICGDSDNSDHIQIAVNPAVYALAVDALRHGGHASATRFNPKQSCHGFSNNTYSHSYFEETVDRMNKIIANASASTTYQATGYTMTLVEPPLKDYVCKKGQATVCGET